jgi:hypothetical protein
MHCPKSLVGTIHVDALAFASPRVAATLRERQRRTRRGIVPTSFLLRCLIHNLRSEHQGTEP